MKSLAKRLNRLAMAATISIGGAGSSFALPITIEPVAVNHAVVKVQMRRDRHDGRHHDRRHPGRHDRWERRGDAYYYHGHRGYRHRRAGYREYNGWWFPPAAFVAGAIISGAIANGNGNGNSNDHVRWCSDQYRSYRVSDDTFQPYNGPRQRCLSPYD